MSILERSGPRIEINQAMPVFSLPDAVGNHALQTQIAIAKAGMQGSVWAERVLVQAPEVRTFDRYRSGRRRRGVDRILLYQASTGAEADMVDRLVSYPEPKTLCYHNITPAGFFKPYDEWASTTSSRARDELRRVAQGVRVAVADSTFNADELRELGVEDVHVIPPYLPPALGFAPAAHLLSWLRRTKKGTDLIFVGRVVPNKGHIHLLRAFATFKKAIDPHARLFIVGSWGPPTYMRRLFRLREALDLEGVAFTGSVSAEALVAHYEAADLLVCLSEHEGYGIPLIEAMRFDLPVIAHDAGAVAETLGGAGVLVRTLDARFVAEVIGRVAKDLDLREKIVSRQRARMADLEALPRDELQVKAVLRTLDAS